MSDRDPWDHSGDNHAVSLIISNAYRARHGMESINVHATVDEDIADAILSSDWLAMVKREAAAEALRSVARKAHNGAPDSKMQRFYDEGVALWLEQEALAVEFGEDSE